MVDTDMLLHRSTALKLAHVTLLLALYSFVTCHWRVSFKLANSLSTCTMDWFIALIGTDQCKWRKKERNNKTVYPHRYKKVQGKQKQYLKSKWIINTAQMTIMYFILRNVHIFFDSLNIIIIFNSDCFWYQFDNKMVTYWYLGSNCYFYSLIEENVVSSLWSNVMRPTYAVRFL